MTAALASKSNGAALTAPSRPIDRSLAAEASSAHSRINIPLNLDNWKSLPEEITNELLWFHQWILDNDVGYKEARDAIGYDQTTIYRALKGIYEGSWGNVIKAIRSFRKLEEQRGKIQRNDFTKNGISDIIFSSLDYALANNSITIIEGESRMGKTICGRAWAQENNHGRAVFATAPVIGGISAFVRNVGGLCGINPNKSLVDIADSLYRAFNKNRILIIDEAHRLLPNEFRCINPQKVEFVRDLHDMTGCAIALLVTARWSEHLKKGAYQYEQLVGRVGMPVRLKPVIKRDYIVPIVRQFVKSPAGSLIDALEKIANQPGRLGIMTETLKAASRIASVDKETLGEKHVLAAIAIRTQHSGK